MKYTGTVMLLVIIGLGACMKWSFADELVSEARPHKVFVSNLLSTSLVARTQAYAERAKTLSSGGRGVYPKESSLASFIAELVEQKDWDGLDGFEEALKSIDARKLLWYVVSKSGEEKGRDLLKQWAEKYPTEVLLMRHSQKGEGRLLDALADERRPSGERADAARILSYVVSTNGLPRMRMFENDRTPVVEVSMMKACSIGDVVGECVRRAEERLKRSAEGQRDNPSKTDTGPASDK